MVWITKGWTDCNVKIRECLGFAEFYRRFVRRFATVAQPLFDLIKKGAVFAWTDAAQAVFGWLKSCIKSALVLRYPDFSKPFVITTDASGYGIGAVLSQEHDGFQHPVAFQNRAINAAERRYSTTEQECLAVF
jgi:hypothetical protein